MRYKNVNHPAYVKVRKEAKKEIKKAKKIESKLAQNIKNDKKSFFAYVRNKAKVKPKVGPLAADNGDIVDDSTKMADEFNKKFLFSFN